MKPYRIALANVRFPKSLDDAVAIASRAITEAGAQRAAIVCFPEGFVPGYRAAGKGVAPHDATAIDAAWSQVQEVASRAKVAVVLGTERLVQGKLVLSALVIDADGTRTGFQDKVQLDPSEEGTYGFGAGRRVFRAGALTFGIAICHEGWRYPETVRWAARQGAQLVFHPHFHEADATSFPPTQYGDPRNTFHEKAVLCRAAENTIYFATVNHASVGSPSTSAVAAPDGSLLAHQPYGEDGVLVAELDLDLATGLLASRYRPT